MKYIVITSKHHDGFSLFDGPGEYDVVDASPYRKDILQALSDACQRHGIKFCTYYSIMDWHHPSQTPAKVVDGRPVWNPTKMIDGQKAGYVKYMKSQLEVLVKNLDTHVLWFDGEWPDWWTDQDGRELYGWLLEMNPELIVNNRVVRHEVTDQRESRGDAFLSCRSWSPLPPSARVGFAHRSAHSRKLAGMFGQRPASLGASRKQA